VPLDKVTALEPAMRLILTVTKSPQGYSHLTRLRGIDGPTLTNPDTPGRQQLEQQFAAYQAKTLAWRQWHTIHEGIGVELVDATRRVHGTVQAIPTHLRVTDIDAAAEL